MGEGKHGSMEEEATEILLVHNEVACVAPEFIRELLRSDHQGEVKHSLHTLERLAQPSRIPAMVNARFKRGYRPWIYHRAGSLSQ